MRRLVLILFCSCFFAASVFSSDASEDVVSGSVRVVVEPGMTLTAKKRDKLMKQLNTLMKRFEAEAPHDAKFYIFYSGRYVEWEEVQGNKNNIRNTLRWVLEAGSFVGLCRQLESCDFSTRASRTKWGGGGWCFFGFW